MHGAARGARWSVPVAVASARQCGLRAAAASGGRGATARALAGRLPEPRVAGRTRERVAGRERRSPPNFRPTPKPGRYGARLMGRAARTNEAVHAWRDYTRRVLEAGMVAVEARVAAGQSLDMP